MTGGEPAAAAAAKAAAQAAAKAVADDPDVKRELLAIAKETPAMRAAAESYAKRVAVRQAVMLKLFSPLGRWMGIQREYFETRFPEEMAARTSHIPEDQLVTPSPSLAVPAIEGLGYSVDEPSLREMYLNLLATASNAQRADQAHPSFPTIVKQLSPREASVLLYALHGGDRAIAQVQFWKAGVPHGGYNVVVRNLIQIPERMIEAHSWPAVAMWIDNWVRLGLVDISWTEHITNPGAYDWVPSSPPYQGYANVPPEAGRVDLAQGVLRITNLGRFFAAAVGPDPAAPSRNEVEGEVVPAPSDVRGGEGETGS